MIQHPDDCECVYCGQPTLDYNNLHGGYVCCFCENLSNLGTEEKYTEEDGEDEGISLDELDRIREARRMKEQEERRSLPRYIQNHLQVLEDTMPF